ncbi:hypothetical protein LJB42_003904 [Komagataella kurtzmanii]|nr:hypothetical protein LJB42_003904 [Komagataella kurtzmanii]
MVDSRPENVSYSSIPSGRHKGKTHIIIVGAGIIGVCTAFYLTRHSKFDPEKYHITILESKRVAGGASGKAGGLLALWAFPQQIVPLSFQLHSDLSEEFGGEDEWGYRRLTTLSVQGDISGQGIKGKEKSANTQQRKSAVTKNSIQVKSDLETEPSTLPESLNWIDKEFITEWNQLGNEQTTAQVHPYKFTTYILKECLKSEAVELLIGKVDDILFDEETGHCNGVFYSPSSNKAVYDQSIGKKYELESDKVIMSIGPWTTKILPDCPISGLRAHSITIKPKEPEIAPFAIFSELKTGPRKFASPEMYARKDEIYVCGEGDTTVPIPETTDDVEIVSEKCDELLNYVSCISSNIRNGKILKTQACYLPVVDIPSSSGPLIGETNVPNLYLASGHSCWGINNAPATGILMSELILDGEAHTCDISALDPSLYFDASLIYDSENDSEEVEEEDISGDTEDEDDDENEEDDNDITAAFRVRQ